MKKSISIVILTIGLILLGFINSYAQQPNKLDEVKAFINNWKNLNSISYDADLLDKAWFSEDTLLSKNHSEIILDTTGIIVANKDYNISEEFEGTLLYNGQRKTFLFNNNTYDEYKNSSVNHGIFGNGGIIDSIFYNLKNHPHKFQILPDTIINNVNCIYFKYIQRDEETEEGKMYDYFYFAFDKTTYEPKLYRSIRRGQLSVKDYSMGTANLFNETRFKNVEKDKLIFDIKNFSPPSTAQLAVYEKKELLGKGDENPKWKMQDLEGNHFNSEDFKGKNTLLFLTVIDCPANQLSIKTINSMVDQFGEKIQVIGIYDEKDERLKKYVQSNPLKFPIIANGEDVKKQYHATGSPYYYLIDKDGKIFYSNSGYSDKLDGELIKNIEEMIK